MRSTSRCSGSGGSDPAPVHNNRTLHRDVTRLTCLLVVLFLLENVSGSCLSYGHSCWGAHGKRSEGDKKDDTRWFLSKLVGSGEDQMRLWRSIDPKDVPHPGERLWKNNENDVNEQLLIKKPQDRLEHSDGADMVVDPDFPELLRNGLEEVLLMSDDPSVQKHPRVRNMSLYKIMDRVASSGK